MNTTATLNTNSIFDTKEQYVAFRAKWKQLYAEGFHKPVRHEYQYGGTVEKTGELNEYGNPRYTIVGAQTGFYMSSPLTVMYHLIFNLALGRDPVKAFRECNNPNVFRSKFYAVRTEKNWTKLFEPFGDVITPEQRKVIAQRLTDYMKVL